MAAFLWKGGGRRGRVSGASVFFSPLFGPGLCFSVLFSHVESLSCESDVTPKQIVVDSFWEISSSRWGCLGFLGVGFSLGEYLGSFSVLEEGDDGCLFDILDDFHGGGLSSVCHWMASPVSVS